MARKVPIPTAARLLRRHPRTIENWIARHLITPFLTPEGDVVVDLDQIELSLKLYPRRMRDGRLVAGVVPVPITGEPVTSGGGQ